MKTTTTQTQWQESLSEAADKDENKQPWVCVVDKVSIKYQFNLTATSIDPLTIPIVLVSYSITSPVRDFFNCDILGVTFHVGAYDEKLTVKWGRTKKD